MSLSLAYLVSRYPAISHTFILREVLELRRAGFRIEVASINGPDRPPEELTEEERTEAAATFYVKAAGIAGALRAHLMALGRPVAYVSGILYATKLARLDLRKLLMNAFYFVEAVMIGRWMKERGIKHLHVHFATPASTVGLIAAKIFPLSLSLTVHGPDEFYDVPGYLLADKISAAKLVCAIGFFARSQLMKISNPAQWDKIKITPLGVDPAVFVPRPFRSDSKTFEIICVGRLVPAKGQHVLLAAVERLLSQGRAVRLRLVGDGPDRDSLQRIAGNHGMAGQVIFEGAVNQDRIRGLFEQADAFALASFAEGIPVVLMEAMAMEIPCVTTWINGIPELIRNSIDGLLVAPSDDEGFAAAIARLMDDEELRRRIGVAGRRRVMEKYDLKLNVARLGRVFEEAVA
jgi:colanic acid/amylovoran biosynthesis glycosyltransferase